MLTKYQLHVIVPVSAVLLIAGCQAHVNAGEKTAHVYISMLDEAIKFNDSFKARPEIASRKDFCSLVESSSTGLKNDRQKAEFILKAFKDGKIPATEGYDSLYSQIRVEVSFAKDYPKNILVLYGPGPMSISQQPDKDLVSWVEGLDAIWQLRIAEIMKIIPKS